MTILLATLNARYHHTAFGLRYLLANMGDLRGQTRLCEFTIQQPPLEIVAEILKHEPRIVGFGVYIWNVTETTRVISDLKRLRPELVVVLGGPEVSYEVEDQEIYRLADFVITGEADLAFAELCRDVLRPFGPLAPARETGRDERRGPLAPASGERGGGEGVVTDVANPSGLAPNSSAVKRSPPHPNPLPRNGGEGTGNTGLYLIDEKTLSPAAWSTGQKQQTKVIAAPLPELPRVELPYELYTDEDLAHRVIYVEASRGCPFTCEFCLSALDIPVRQFPLDAFLAALQRLLDRGARQFKFVDRTFNLNLKVSRAILEFFLERFQPELFLHFEMIPDRLPESLKEILAKFPAGSLQLEIGIQTFNESVGELISRRQDNRLAEENLRWLRTQTQAHLHTDLIVGLPGESWDSFAAGFDRLVALGPQEIQIGILKRLRGTPITRHDAEWGMIYSPHPPYEVLQTRLLDFAMLQELRRFAKAWDLIANSGNFVQTLPWLLGNATMGSRDLHHSAIPRRGFEGFRQFAAWLFQQTGQSHGIALSRLVELVYRYLTVVVGLPIPDVSVVLLADYRRGGRSDTPSCLRASSPSEPVPPPSTRAPSKAIPSRQQRHL